MDKDFPRGAGDPDFYGYPGQTIEIPDNYYEDKLIQSIEEADDEDSSNQ